MHLSATYIIKAARDRKSRWTISQKCEWQVKRFELPSRAVWIHGCAAGREKNEIRGHLKFNFVARLSKQINPSAIDQEPDDSEKLGHDYPPRRAVRVSSGEDSWTSPGILACRVADAPAGNPDGCDPARA